ncbi:MAG TPA: serine/threonine-protein kinase [Caulobacteraceae bacterium]|jgi:serine/threonine protein kinase|nr:serine/threonine-protein kinase [Caulobacteraceae bacterium]
MNQVYSHRALPEGAMLREWRLERVLGVGGFGIVYQGRGAYFDELVAIKEYFPSAISDRVDGATVAVSDSSAEEVFALGRDKFLEEAKVLWNLSKPERHPNIVSVRSLFEINGTAYMVMDFEDGLSLSEMLKAGRKFDEADLIALIRPIADGLCRAHEGGVLHRDIKPANIIVDTDGRPVLIDFGSARFDHGQATSTKVTFYTPPYAALEQYVKTYVQGPWTDIYALAVVMYQCVTGEKPPEVLERLHAGLGEPLAAKDHPGFSARFLRAVDAGMAIKPEQRPQSIPQWLAMFDAPVEVEDDERTRIIIRPATREENLEAAQAPAPTVTPQMQSVPAASVAVPAAALASASGADAKPAGGGLSKLMSDRAVVFGAGAVLGVAILVAGGAVVLSQPHRGDETTATPAAGTAPHAASTATAVHASTAGPASAPGIVQAADQLLADAKQNDRPRNEIGTLSKADASIRALAGQISGADAAKRADLDTQIVKAATDMAKGEATALDRSAASQSRDIEKSLAGQGGAALSTLRAAKTRLGQTVADVSNASDPTGALGATRGALVAYGDFSKAATAAGTALAPIKRSKLQAAVSDARAIGNAVIADAGKPKPWLFASGARKQAYQILQDNAAKAKVQLARLDDLSRSATSADAKSLDASIAQAGGIKSSLNGLYAASSAALAAK